MPPVEGQDEQKPHDEAPPQGGHAIIVGFGLDRFVFGTTPWITIGLMFLAFIAACIQVVRSNSNRAG